MYFKQILYSENDSKHTSKSCGFLQHEYGTAHRSGLKFCTLQLKYMFLDQSLYPWSDMPQH